MFQHSAQASYFFYTFSNLLPISFLLPLCQGYEDWLRHKADCSINECPVDVVQQEKVVRTQSHKLRVRMASLGRRCTWGHKATLLHCCNAHFFLKLSLPLPLCFPLCSAFWLSFLSFWPIIGCKTVIGHSLVWGSLQGWTMLMYFVNHNILVLIFLSLMRSRSVVGDVTLCFSWLNY